MGGFRNAALRGMLTGHPLIRTRCVLEDGLAHDVDSSDQAFQAAALGAFQQAYREAAHCVLEPLMSVEVAFPTEFQVQTLQTLNQREGSIQNTRVVSGDTSLIECTVPLRRMFGYSSELRSATQGMGEFAMEFSTYEQMPGHKQEELMTEYRASRSARHK